MKNNEFVEINGIVYLINLIPSDRRSVSFRMISSREIDVRYPKSMSFKKVKEFIKLKRGWIEKKHIIFKAAEEAGSGKGICEGRLLYVFGKQYSVKQTGSIIEIIGKNIHIPTGATIEDLEKWYGQMSEEAVAAFIETNKKIIPQCTIKIKKQKNMWGSCNSKKRIYINNRISMCPISVIDYIMWHEITHLKHMNHSGNFYRQLSKNCPDFKSHSNWLKRNSLNMRI